MADSLLFDERFLDAHAGAIITDPEVAIVELVANAWDAWATEVKVLWSEKGDERVFSIADNGKGMTEGEFQRRWKTISYNRLVDQGTTSTPPTELQSFAPRAAYGRNGKGRHAAFRFGNPYQVKTWRDGLELTYSVKRGKGQPFEVEETSRRTGVPGHGTEVSTPQGTGSFLPAQDVREILGTRFLSDPNFTVWVDGTKVTFEDVPAARLREIQFEVPGCGPVHITVIDAQRVDKTTRQHGIAWWVQSRLVGKSGWIGFDHEKILDGRTAEAKRFSFIVRADYLANSGAVLADWTGFHGDNNEWTKTRDAVHKEIREVLAEFTSQRRSDTKQAVRSKLEGQVSRLTPISRDKWNNFVDDVVDAQALQLTRSNRSPVSSQN